MSSDYESSSSSDRLAMLTKQQSVPAKQNQLPKAKKTQAPAGTRTKAKKSAPSSSDARKGTSAVPLPTKKAPARNPKQRPARAGAKTKNKAATANKKKKVSWLDEADLENDKVYGTDEESEVASGLSKGRDNNEDTKTDSEISVGQTKPLPPIKKAIGVKTLPRKPQAVQFPKPPPEKPRPTAVSSPVPVLSDAETDRESSASSAEPQDPFVHPTNTVSTYSELNKADTLPETPDDDPDGHAATNKPPPTQIDIHDDTVPTNEPEHSDDDIKALAFNRGAEQVVEAGLDNECRQMFTHILQLAAQPSEWLDDLQENDYRIHGGRRSAMEFGHSAAHNILTYVLRKMNDNPTKAYEPILFDYEEITLRVSGTPDDTEREKYMAYSASQIWEPFKKVAYEGEKLLDTRPEHRAEWTSTLWKLLTERTHHVLRDLDVEAAPRPERNVSFVLLLVLTLAPKKEVLKVAMGREERVHSFNERFEDLVADALKCLRHKAYPTSSTCEVTAIFSRLSKHLQREQKEHGYVMLEGGLPHPLTSAVHTLPSTPVSPGGSPKDRLDGRASPSGFPKRTASETLDRRSGNGKRLKASYAEKGSRSESDEED
ncbi:hypothetical protein BDW02DRAFT_583037 [Decorospora gaudefroyi]|uniref:Uncharacterized protein n=1 Tax=Decorospora gaudefroyi TaxID=184978 RepID=A0A6A5JYR6_9PLEO|nr:hypothetical protein BDW02DRAFT_583037 [Decorospora gaudefroyi]